MLDVIERVREGRSSKKKTEREREREKEKERKVSRKKFAIYGSGKGYVLGEGDDIGKGLEKRDGFQKVQRLWFLLWEK